MTNSQIGQLLGPNDVEDAVTSTLRAWLPDYLYQVEQDNGLDEGTLTRPPSPESVRGGIDFELWEEDGLPTVIVTVRPLGRPERDDGYNQWYDVQVCAVLADENENDARRRAAYYGAAIQAILVQRGALGGFTEDTRMSAAPVVEFLDPEERRLVQCTSGYEVFVENIVNDHLGLLGPTPPVPPFGELPTVQKTTVSLDTLPLT